MIVRRGKNACTTNVKVFDGRERVAHIVVGTSPLDCARHAGGIIARAIKAGHDVSWNSEGGNEIRVFRSTEDYNSGDRYIRSYTTTASDRGRIVSHRESKRANPTWEGLKECEICHKCRVGVRPMRNDAIGRDMLACPADQKILKILNEVEHRRAAGIVAEDGGR